MPDECTDAHRSSERVSILVELIPMRYASSASVFYRDFVFHFSSFFCVMLSFVFLFGHVFVAFFSVFSFFFFYVSLILPRTHRTMLSPSDCLALPKIRTARRTCGCRTCTLACQDLLQHRVISGGAGLGCT